MLFQSGNNANPAGRPKGANGKPIKEKLETLLQKNFKVIEKDLESAAPEVRRDFFIKLAAVVVANGSPELLNKLPINKDNAVQ